VCVCVSDKQMLVYPLSVLFCRLSVCLFIRAAGPSWAMPSNALSDCPLAAETQFTFLLSSNPHIHSFLFLQYIFLKYET